LLTYYTTSIDWVYDQEKDELSFVLHVPDAEASMTKLLEGATQLDLAFGGEHRDGASYLTFILRSGNGEIGILLPKQDWPRFLEEPDRMIIDYGKNFEMNFLPNSFLNFIDKQIEKVNEGSEDPFLWDIIEVFAEEEVQ
jgi:hypothetical protein